MSWSVCIVFWNVILSFIDFLHVVQFSFSCSVGNILLEHISITGILKSIAYLSVENRIMLSIV